MLILCSYRASPSKEHATVRITAGVTITPELAEPVSDSCVINLLSEDIRDSVVQVSNINNHNHRINEVITVQKISN